MTTPITTQPGAREPGGAATASAGRAAEPPSNPPGAPPGARPGTAPGRPRRKPRNLRWLRLVVPPSLVVVVLLVGFGLYQAEQPDPGDAAYLSPQSRAAIGSAELADRVRAAGVSVVRERKSSDALVAAHDGNATLLITTPQLVHPYYLRMIKLLPATTRVVIVEPDVRAITDGLLPFTETGRGYAAKVTAPGCGYAPAAQAGPAAVVRTRYGAVRQDLGHEIDRCYDGALVVYQRQDAQVTVVGSADPFRNDRIGEHGNARLVTALLTAEPELIWLDLHERDAPPGVVNDPNLAGGPAAPASLRPNRPGESGQPGDTETDFPIQGPAVRPSAGTSTSGEQHDHQADKEPPNPLLQAFPRWTYVTAALVGLMVLLLMAALSVRLGAPVVEPLPVVVRSTETVAGRARLYERSRARPESLQILRDAALVRLSRLLRLEPDAGRTVLVEAAAASSGWAPRAVEHVLFGPAPENDTELVDAATRLEQLLDAVASEHGAASQHGVGAEHVVASEHGVAPGPWERGVASEHGVAFEHGVASEHPGAQPAPDARHEGEAR